MWWWLRSLATGAAVGLGVGFVVGGTLGRIFMRILFLSREDTRGFETAMGAIVGDLTGGGTLFICAFGAVMGLGLGLAYVCLRAFVPSRGWWRGSLFVYSATGLMLGLLVRVNRDDFAILPVTLSLFLIVASVAVTAVPVPILVERFAPGHDRSPGPVARAAVGVGAVAIAVFAATAIATAYSA